MESSTVIVISCGARPNDRSTHLDMTTLSYLWGEFDALKLKIRTRAASMQSIPRAI